MATPDCAICMMPLTNPACGPCGDHTFCLGCLRAALAVNRECPSCRAAALPGWTPRVSTFMRSLLESAAVMAAAPAPAVGISQALQLFLQAQNSAQQQQHEMMQKMQLATQETMLKAQLAAQETMRQSQQQYNETMRQSQLAVQETMRQALVRLGGRLCNFLLHCNSDSPPLPSHPAVRVWSRAGGGGRCAARCGRRTLDRGSTTARASRPTRSATSCSCTVCATRAACPSARTARARAYDT